MADKVQARTSQHIAELLQAIIKPEMKPFSQIEECLLPIGITHDTLPRPGGCQRIQGAHKPSPEKYRRHREASCASNPLTPTRVRHPPNRPLSGRGLRSPFD
jgi:hypothetical protein